MLLEIKYYLVFLFNFWLHCMACRILVPRPGIEPTPPAVEAWSLNHWTTREVPYLVFHSNEYGSNNNSNTNRYL